MQNKKALVIAVTVALAIPGYSLAAKGDDADSIVELYGKVYPELVFPSGSGATSAGSQVSTLSPAPSGEKGIINKTEIESSNSRFGVRGHEKLSSDLKAIFQLETEFHVDANDSRFAQRDSFVGLDSKRWGTIKLGRMDTPFKSFGDELSFLGVSSGNFTSSSNVLRVTGYGTSSSSSFHLRRQNAVQYEMPDMHGLEAAVMYSTDETDTSSRHAHVWSGAVAYEAGPIRVSLAHERHWDLFGGSRNAPSSMSNFNDQSVRSRDKATQAMILWKAGKHSFEADYIRKEYKENASLTGRFQSYKNNAYELIWQARWTPQWRTQLQYIHATAGECSRVNAVCDTGGLDGSQWQAGVAYYFSRKTYLFLMASWLKNGYSARYNNENQQDPEVGEDIRQVGIGLYHSF